MGCYESNSSTKPISVFKRREPQPSESNIVKTEGETPNMANENATDAKPDKIKEEDNNALNSSKNNLKRDNNIIQIYVDDLNDKDSCMLFSYEVILQLKPKKDMIS